MISPAIKHSVSIHSAFYTVYGICTVLSIELRFQLTTAAAGFALVTVASPSIAHAEEKKPKVDILYV
jgi:hypothetical protein